MTTESLADGTAKRAALERRFEALGWGVLLMAVGTIWLLPDVPHGSWLIAAGVIMLGLNAIRSFNGLRASGFSLVVGMLALIAGLGEFFGVAMPLFPIALIVIGAGSLLKALRYKHSGPTTDQGWSCCGSRSAGE